jgi:hypothetical protein
LKTHRERERERERLQQQSWKEEISSIISFFFGLEGLIVQQQQAKESGNRKPR